MRLLKNLTTGESAEQDNSGVAQAVPQSVSMAQARKALFGAGLLGAIDAAIAGIADEAERERAAIDWEYAAEVRRDSPLVASLAPALGLGEAQIDALFTAAAVL
jgi:hypothetical protein